MTTPTRGDYDTAAVDGIDTLRSEISDAEDNNTYSERITAWSHILSDYLSFGNTKISKEVAIFNLNSATDCPNAETDECQVDFSDCYAHKAENIYPNTLPYRRRQEYVWDCLDAETFAYAFIEVVERKRNPVTGLRLSEAGDVRHDGDIHKAERIAEILSAHDISVYTYSASSYLDAWDTVENLTVNQSNNFDNYGDRLYSAVPKPEDIPEGALECPHNYQKRKGNDDPVKCGDCRLCIDKDAPDVFITLH
jgi:hypothetical protein